MSEIVVTTKEQIKEVFMEALRDFFSQSQPTTKQSEERRYVYGLRGIRELFNISHKTAQAWKDGFLAPAVNQRGRIIRVDVDMAEQLFNARNQFKTQLSKI